MLHKGFENCLDLKNKKSRQLQKIKNNRLNNVQNYDQHNAQIKMKNMFDRRL